MKIVLGELSEAVDSFDKILGAEIDIKLAYRIRKISSKIMAEMKSYNEQRGELLKQYGEKDKNGEMIQLTGRDGKLEFKIAKENVTKFEKEFKELIALEVDIGGEKIPFDCMEGIKMSGYDIAKLENFIEAPVDHNKTNEKKEVKKDIPKG